MATFTIIIKNKSAKKQNYMFFNAPPAQVAGPQLWSNVWVTARDIDTPRGATTVVVKEDMFAVCGTGPSPLAAGVTVQSSDYAPVKLTSASAGGTITKATVTNDSITIEATSNTLTPPVTDAYGIDLSSFVAGANPNIFVGHGKYDGDGNVVPVTTWYPQSLNNYVVEPIIIFYVATGDYVQGTCVDVTSYGPMGTIDFSKANPGQLTAEITQEDDNSWGEPVFS